MPSFSNPLGLPYYCVVGQPINHSLSPAIHQAFADSLDIELIYTRVEVGPGNLASALGEFYNCGGKGMNITVPLKEEAVGVATVLTERATLAGAANTIVVQGVGNYLADNTDGVGLVTDLTANLRASIASRDILILGAGGAVRGVIAPLLDCRPARIIIANRTLSKARVLVNRFESLAADKRVELDAISYQQLASARRDIVINGTSLGLTGKVPPLPDGVVDKETLVYDMMYDRSGATAFTRWAREKGVQKAFDGLGMLVEQAAEAFYLWHGRRPQTQAVIASFRTAK